MVLSTPSMRTQLPAGTRLTSTRYRASEIHRWPTWGGRRGAGEGEHESYMESWTDGQCECKVYLNMNCTHKVFHVALLVVVWLEMCTAVVANLSNC